ncbi:hypothetical protein Slu03_30250 [Sediminihabitans luteus]|nr:hypothetical protein Slu03_30250 [Sediminihabitans luteus]
MLQWPDQELERADQLSPGEQVPTAELSPSLTRPSLPLARMGLLTISRLQTCTRKTLLLAGEGRLTQPQMLALAMVVHHCDGVAMSVKCIEGWTPAQRAAADGRVCGAQWVYNGRDSGSRERECAKGLDFRGSGRVSSADIDHAYDLQLGGH